MNLPLIPCVGDCCSLAVRRAYEEMQCQDQPESFAFEAACVVFNWYHPEVSRLETEITVSGWVRPGFYH